MSGCYYSLVLMSEPPSALPRTLAILERGIADRLHFGAQIYASLHREPVADFALGEVRTGGPMQREALMPWLSSGKPITALALAQLLERGMVEIDQPVDSIIPAFGANGKGPITLRHLLTHTGGFRSADKIPEDISWPETIARICEAPLEIGWIPGQKAGYHTSSSWFILGEIVRRLDGRPLDLYAREEILVPLGMVDSWLAIPPDQYRTYDSRIGTIHPSAGLRPTRPPGLDSEAACGRCRPGGSARGPIRELGRFYEMLLAGGEGNGHQVLKSKTVEYFTKRHRVAMFDHTFQHTLDFVLGFILNSNRYGIETVPYGYGRHASEESFGHSGAQSSCAFADPAHGLVVAWVCNGMPGERRHQQRVREINCAIYEDLALA